MIFKISDYLIPAFIGGVTGLCVFWVIGPGWNMFFAMVLGMILGMISQVFVFLIFMPLFGALEIMFASMIAGMGSGMINGMLVAMHSISLRLVILIGAAVGIIANAWILKQNRKLQGKVK